MIIEADYIRFHQNMCVVLAEDNNIYLVDLDLLEVVYVFKPTIIMCDSALSITFSH